MVWVLATTELDGIDDGWAELAIVAITSVGRGLGALPFPEALESSRATLSMTGLPAAEGARTARAALVTPELARRGRLRFRALAIAQLVGGDAEAVCAHAAHPVNGATALF